MSCGAVRVDLSPEPAVFPKERNKLGERQDGRPHHEDAVDSAFTSHSGDTRVRVRKESLLLAPSPPSPSLVPLPPLEKYAAGESGSLLGRGRGGAGEGWVGERRWVECDVEFVAAVLGEDGLSKDSWIEVT